MRTKNEITNKINKLLELVMVEKDPTENERICCQIDALLWAIGDRSGGPLADEARN